MNKTDALRSGSRKGGKEMIERRHGEGYRRFQLMYDKRVTFSIESTAGTCITITIRG